jgi:hypothetical protein
VRRTPAHDALCNGNQEFADGGISGTDFASLLSMEKKTNQERGRKYGGSSSFVDKGQPSRAPRQDEEGPEANRSAPRDFGPADGTSPQQGISNRPAKDEHAFPDSDKSDPDAVPDSVDDEPKQVGGNRGQV